MHMINSKDVLHLPRYIHRYMFVKLHTPQYELCMKLNCEPCWNYESLHVFIGTFLTELDHVGSMPLIE